MWLEGGSGGGWWEVTWCDRGVTEHIMQGPVGLGWTLDFTLSKVGAMEGSGQRRVLTGRMDGQTNEVALIQREISCVIGQILPHCVLVFHQSLWLYRQGRWPACCHPLGLLPLSRTHGERRR